MTFFQRAHRTALRTALTAVVAAGLTGLLWAQEGASKPVPAKYDVSKIGERQIGKGMNLYSIDKEIALGKHLAADVEQTAKIITDPVVADYVNRVGQNLVRNSDAKVPFVIKVIDDDAVNAMALPGGFFYVNSGLILAADNEAELAGVMAHEIAHVAARHATKQATKSEIFNFASVPLIFIGGGAGYAIRQVFALAVPMGFLKFSRNNEREADLLGLEYQYAAGYDPVAFVEFFEKLETQEKQHHGALAKAFSTHPMTEDRVKSAQEEIQKYLPERAQYVVDTSEFDQVKARLSALVNGTRVGPGDETRPVLRRRSPDDSGSSDQKSEEGDRPVLRKKSP
jgi:predicted Zn-dependent protease